MLWLDQCLKVDIRDELHWAWSNALLRLWMRIVFVFLPSFRRLSLIFLEMLNYPQRKQKETASEPHPKSSPLCLYAINISTQIPRLLSGARNSGWNLNKMFHSSSLSFSSSLSPALSATFSLPLSSYTYSLSHLAFSPRASLSVSESADAMEKRGEVNSLSPCLINNVTQRLTEWVWMAAARMKWLEYFLHPLPSRSLTCLI